MEDRREGSVVDRKSAVGCLTIHGSQGAAEVCDTLTSRSHLIVAFFRFARQASEHTFGERRFALRALLSNGFLRNRSRHHPFIHQS